MTASFLYRKAAKILRDGGVVAYPTEAVFGLGCLPQNYTAIERILNLKQRDPGMGFILVASDFEQLAGYVAPLRTADLKKLQATWPGPVTWVVPAAEDVPAWLTGGRNTIAVRVSAAASVKALCDACDSALVSTSANISGRQPTRTALATRRRFGLDIDFVVPGSVAVDDAPTEIRDLASGKTIRPA